VHPPRVHSFTLNGMHHPKLSDIAGIINKKYPFRLAEDWDNVGIQLGTLTTEIRRILVALDPLPAVFDEALAQHCDLLVTHHPLIFSPLRQITSSTSTGSSIIKAIRGGLAHLAMHTNFDIAGDGLNDLLAARLQLQGITPLKVSGHVELVKLVVFVPADQLEQVRHALCAHAEQLGNYRDCSFAALGEGTFLPLEGAQPAIGCVGSLERVAEQRLELLVRRDRLTKAVRTLLAVHPYEEPAFDCYPLLNESQAYGLGRIGRLAAPQPLQELARTIGNRLGCRDLRVVGDRSRTIQTVALCSGSGASLLREAARAGADLLLTGDVKYHDAREAEALGIALLDAGHFSTEQLMVGAVRDFLIHSCQAAGYAVEVFGSRCEADPFHTITV